MVCGHCRGRRRIGARASGLRVMLSAVVRGSSPQPRTPSSGSRRCRTRVRRPNRCQSARQQRRPGRSRRCRRRARRRSQARRRLADAHEPARRSRRRSRRPRRPVARQPSQGSTRTASQSLVRLGAAARSSRQLAPRIANPEPRRRRGTHSPARAASTASLSRARRRTPSSGRPSRHSRARESVMTMAAQPARAASPRLAALVSIIWSAPVLAHPSATGPAHRAPRQIPSPTSDAARTPSGIASVVPVAGRVATGVAIGDRDGGAAGGVAAATRSVAASVVVRSTPPNAPGSIPLAWATNSSVASGPGANAPAACTYALAPASSAVSAEATAVVPAPAASRSSTAFAVVVQSVPLPNAEGIAPFVAASRAAR